MTDRIWICERKLHVSTLPALLCAQCKGSVKQPVPMERWTREHDAQQVRDAYNIFTLEYADTPPSYNSFQRSHWRKQARIKREWQGIWEGLLMASPIQRNAYRAVEVDIELRFPTAGRRDAGNFQTPIEKTLGDALVNGGWLPDDTHDRFRIDTVSFLPKGEPLTRLVLKFTPTDAVGSVAA